MSVGKDHIRRKKITDRQKDLFLMLDISRAEFLEIEEQLDNKFKEIYKILKELHDDFEAKEEEE